MTPELQNYVQQVHAAQQAQFTLVLLFGGIIFISIVVCAVYAVRIFWKLCDIDELMRWEAAQRLSQGNAASGSEPAPAPSLGTAGETGENPFRRRHRSWQG